MNGGTFEVIGDCCVVDTNNNGVDARLTYNGKKIKEYMYVDPVLNFDYGKIVEIAKSFGVEVTTEGDASDILGVRDLGVGIDVSHPPYVGTYEIAKKERSIHRLVCDVVGEKKTEESSAKWAFDKMEVLHLYSKIRT